MARKSVEEQLDEARETLMKDQARVTELEKRVAEKRKKLFEKVEKQLGGRTLREGELTSMIESFLSSAAERSEAENGQGEPAGKEAQNPAKEEPKSGARKAPKGTDSHAPETAPTAQMSIDEVLQ